MALSADASDKSDWSDVEERIGSKLPRVTQTIFTVNLSRDDREDYIVAMFVKFEDELNSVQLVCDAKIDGGG